MPTRLDLQKPARKRHARFNTRFYRRGYTTNPHDVWGDWSTSKATTGTAGTPGSFSGGTETPRTFAQLVAWAVTASPTSTWTVGQRVVLGDGTTAHWHTTNGWVAGNAP